MQPWRSILQADADSFSWWANDNILQVLQRRMPAWMERGLIIAFLQFAYTVHPCCFSWVLICCTCNSSGKCYCSATLWLEETLDLLLLLVAWSVLECLCFVLHTARSVNGLVKGIKCFWVNLARVFTDSLITALSDLIRV